MRTQSRPGFTLVEMLVATALVLLMMLLFAQVFQTAGGLVSNQKGMAEQDQNVRTLTILLRGDMKSRTFVDVVPFSPGQNTAGVVGPKYVPERRRGFFSIAENNPDDTTDDVLHLTITTEAEPNTASGNSPYLPYSGRAAFMFNGTSPTNPDQYLLDNPDQPEFDDGQVTINKTGSSRFAEVVWFLRNGTLYRRQLLVRDPYSRPPGSTEEPRDSAGADFVGTTYAGEEHVNTTTNFNGVFWRDFDYAAYTDLDNNTKFHDLVSLDNKSDSLADPLLVGFPRSLGIPFLRYGSSISRVTATQLFGPRDFIDHTDPATFIGRFTVEESTHHNFAYPGNRTLATDPTNSAGTGPALTLTDGRVNEYKYGFTLPAAHPTRAGQIDDNQRRGEDIVMSGVHSFDIQVWDDELRGFANLGHAKTSPAGRRGWYHRDFHQNPDFANDPTGDDTGANHYSYDTWHPFAAMPVTPYRPLGSNPESQPDPGLLPNFGLGASEEVPLRAIQIQIRFHEINSDSMRDLTFTFPLN